MPFKITEKFKKLHQTVLWRKALRRIHLADWSLKFNEPKNELPDNRISTGIYNIVNFVPKSLALQFSRPVNIYFLMIGIMQCIPSISSTDGKPLIFLPLGMIIIFASIKEIIEDYKRHKSDDTENNKVSLYNNNGKFEQCTWESIRVGQIIKVLEDETFPADVLVLNTSLKNGICYIETKNLDGETNLKPKIVHKDMYSHFDNEEKLIKANHPYKFEKPNEYLYKFIGCVEVAGSTVAVNDQNFILRGCVLRNTSYVYGIVTYTGHFSKVMLNSTNSKAKLSKMELDMGKMILIVFGVMIFLCSFAALYGGFWFKYSFSNLDYIDPNDVEVKEDGFWYNFGIGLGSWFLLLSKYVPISLVVNCEIVRLAQAFLISYDPNLIKMPEKIKPTVQSPSLTEELGQIEYIFSDKTGTLTKNIMDFKTISIAGELYGFKPKIEEEHMNMPKVSNVDFWDPDLFEDLENPSMNNHKFVTETVIMLALCHTAVVQEKDGDRVYNTSSPDELALVNFAKYVGYEFMGTDDEDNYLIKTKETLLKYKLLQVFEFNSDRKRMSVVVKDPEGKIILYTKGADTVLLEKMDEYDVDNNYYMMCSNQHIYKFATEGLRTLVLTRKEIEPNVYDAWLSKYEKALSKIVGREEAMEQLQAELEVGLYIMGVTAIEDKLQDDVGLTIAKFKEAGIKVWMLTGDKVETAINIGYSCHLLDEGMVHLHLVEKTHQEVKDSMESKLKTLETGKDKSLRYSLVISGDALIYAIGADLCPTLVKMAKKCQVVIACRVSPKQKQQLVAMMKKDNPKISTLAIGDGANDVYMITAASVGVGIRGLEGQQAARASDFAIGEFKMLRRLLFYHGRENYRRNSYLIFHNFYKNITLGTIYFCFAFMSGFSGTGIFDRYLFELFNTLFTSVPILIFAILDIEFPGSKLENTPSLYVQGMKNKIFTRKKFFQWVVLGIFESALIAFFGLMAFDNVSSHVDGRVYGLYAPGMLIFSSIVWVANIKIFTFTYTFNGLVIFFGVGCSLLYKVCFIIFAQFSFSSIYGFAIPMFLNPSFYLCLVIIVISSFLLTLSYRILKNVKDMHKVPINKVKISFADSPVSTPMKGTDSTKTMRSPLSTFSNGVSSLITTKHSSEIPVLSLDGGR